LRIVVDQNTGRLVWAAPGRDKKTLGKFFAQLGQERCEKIQLVSWNMGGWINAAVKVWIPKVARCVDRFHVIGLATN
jgi:transposase